MKQTEFGVIEKNCYPKAILSDSHISEITFDESGISFLFQNGIAVKELTDETTEQYAYFRTREAAILIDGCSSDDMLCRISYRFSLFGRVYYVCRDLEPKHFIKLLKKRQLKVFDEFYSELQLLWRGVLYPYNRGRLCTQFEIMIYHENGITYCWNEQEQGKKTAFN